MQFGMVFLASATSRTWTFSRLRAKNSMLGFDVLNI